MHLKRNKTPVSWPIPRKGTQWVVIPSHNQETGVPMLIILRDMLEIGKTRKEVERVLKTESVKVNGKVTKDEKYPVSLFDLLDVGGKEYKLVLKNKKFALEESKDKLKISKVIGKRIIPGKKVQINLQDGRNLIGEKANIGDSVFFNISSKKVEKVVAVEKGAKVIVISGSHIGEEGKIESVNEGKVEVKLEKKKVNLDKARVMAI